MEVVEELGDVETDAVVFEFVLLFTFVLLFCEYVVSVEEPTTMGVVVEVVVAAVVP